MTLLFLLISPALSMTLNEARQAAVARAPLMQVSEARLRESEARVRTATATLLPSARLAGGAAWQNEILFAYDTLASSMSSAFQQALEDADIPFDIELELDPDSFPETIIQPGFQWVGSLEASQPILAPGAWLYRKAARQGVTLAQAQQELDRYQVESGVIQAWHASARAHALLQDAQRGVERAEKVLQLAQAVVDNGVLPADHIIQAKEAVASARAAHEQAQVGAQAADQILGTLTGLPGPADPVTVPDTLPELQPLLASLGRPDLQVAQARVDAAQALSKATRAPALPVLGVTANVSYLEPEPYFADQWNYKLMLGITVPLFQGGGVAAQIDEAQAREAQARAGLDALQELARMEVIRTHGQLAGALASLQQREEAVELAQQAVEASDIRFKEGGGSLLDLEQARARLLQAQVQLTLARAEAAQAADLLELVAGG